MGLGLEIEPLRGNIDTRLGKVASGELDAIVIARAGLSRIGRTERITETLEPVQMLPAPSQGALAVECRSDNPDLIAILGELDDHATRAAVVAERALLAELEAGCTARWERSPRSSSRSTTTAEFSRNCPSAAAPPRSTAPM